VTALCSVCVQAFLRVHSIRELPRQPITYMVNRWRTTSTTTMSTRRSSLLTLFRWT
jgi:hypothetical protein